MNIPFSLLPEKNPLIIDYLTHFNKVKEFFSADYHDHTSYRMLAPDILKASHADRGKLLQILLEQNKQMGADEATFHNLTLLQESDTLAIVTGQQAGLFGGPLYTLYKLLTTCKLASFLSQQLHRPVVPVFYLVSEDHDFNEVQWIGYLNQNYYLRKAYYHPSHIGARQPVSDIVLDQNIDTVFNELETQTASSEFKTEILSVLQRAYKPGNRFSDAFSHWYTHLLQSKGLIFMDASDSRIKQLAHPVFTRELRDNTSVQEMIKTNSRLTELGYPLQLAVHAERPHLFILQEGRHSLERYKGGFHNLHDQSFVSKEELIANPQLLSPKAALRPIVQNFLLPTIAYVAGPGEISYWAQLKNAHQAFNLPMPLVVPRASFTLIESKIKRHMEHFNISIEELFADRLAVNQSIRNKMVPSELAETFLRIKNSLQQDWSDLERQVCTLDPTLLSPTEKTQQQLLRHLQHLENRVVASSEQKKSILAEQLRAINEAFFPGGELQERQLNITSWLFKYHWSFIQTIYEAIDLFLAEHKILFI